MGNTNPTQCNRILDYLEKHPDGITQLQAITELGILRLASRVSELRKRGENIEKDTITVKNHYGEKCRIARYRLLKERDNGREANVCENYN
jgi:hypothetical protein